MFCGVSASLYTAFIFSLPMKAYLPIVLTLPPIVTEWRSQLAKAHHVSQYADAMRLTLPHLCSTIKAVGDRTAGDIIIEAIITDAKSQLKITNLQIKEIALNLGFDNVAFFNRFFKSHVGVTPKAYRNA